MDLDSYFDQFTASAFRLEGLPFYGPADSPRLVAWRDGQPIPERSVRTSPWLRRVAVTTVTGGKTWERVHLVSHPLTSYERYEIGTAYVESQAAGEKIGIAVRNGDRELEALAGPDFWLFDAETKHPAVVVMDYTPDGDYQGCREVTDPAQIASYIATRDLVRSRARELNEYLAAQRESGIEAA